MRYSHSCRGITSHKTLLWSPRPENQIISEVREGTIRAQITLDPNASTSPQKNNRKTKRKRRTPTGTTLSGYSKNTTLVVVMRTRKVLEAAASLWHDRHAADHSRGFLLCRQIPPGSKFCLSSASSLCRAWFSC